MSIDTTRSREEQVEFETSTERTVQYVNLSRVLNLIGRELNQELTSYLQLRNIQFRVVYEDGTYVSLPLDDFKQLVKLLSSFSEQSIHDAIAGILRGYETFAGRTLSTTIFEDKETVWRFPHRTHFADTSPFHNDAEQQLLPAIMDGLVLSVTRNIVRTDSVIFDSVLSAGVSLDRFALHSQQSRADKQQLDNDRIRLALKLIGDGDKTRMSLYAKAFPAPEECCSDG